MRYGFTTGSCAAAAAKAAAYMLLTGKKKEQITIETPKGIPYTAQIVEISRSERMVRCAVRKDGGDDPDVTTGTLIYAAVSYADDHGMSEEGVRQTTQPSIRIEGGVGVGRVTRAGLDQPVGSAAINHVPREMIAKEVGEVAGIADYSGALRVVISAPEGVSLAAHTFNPRLGIVDGISILGTSGIVEPMSSRAIVETIRVELRQRRAEGFDYVAVAPGNYGQELIRHKYGYDMDRSVKCSNFIGETIDMAAELGFRRLLLIGHIGKLIKVAGGIMNTHSREADCRLELLAAAALRAGTAAEHVCQLLDCLNTQEALQILSDCGTLQAVSQQIVGRICYYMERRAGGRLTADCVVFADGFGELAGSRRAEEWFTLLGQEPARSI